MTPIHMNAPPPFDGSETIVTKDEGMMVTIVGNGSGEVVAAHNGRSATGYGIADALFKLRIVLSGQPARLVFI